jgi:hypothetical protein
MPNSRFFRSMSNEIRQLDRTYLNFKPRPAGNYTRKQLSSAAAYTVFCHAEIEHFLESWSAKLVDHAEINWNTRKATRPLVHLCTFHKGREGITEVPPNDIWNVPIYDAIRKHREIIKKNNGIKESNVCSLLAPIGFDVTNIDVVLLGDLTAFGAIRGDYAHQSHRAHLGAGIDPFDRKTKVQNLLALLSPLDQDLNTYFTSC